jgi:hypothetical protein
MAYVRTPLKDEIKDLFNDNETIKEKKSVFDIYIHEHHRTNILCFIDYHSLTHSLFLALDPFPTRLGWKDNNSDGRLGIYHRFHIYPLHP